MALIPKITKSAKSEIKHTEVTGAVTVGPETAAILSKKLGREVKPGEKFDLGVLAVYDKNPFKNFWGNVKAAARHTKSPFRKPLKKGIDH